MAGSGPPQLSVVVLARNCADRLAATLERTDAYLRSHRMNAETIVVDDGSTDGTAEVGRAFLRARPGRLLHWTEPRGRGRAMREAAAAARGRWLLLTDAASVAPIERHAALARVALQHDADVVAGYRPAALRPRALGRGSSSALGNRLVRWSTGVRLEEPNCEFKLVDRARTSPLFERMIADGPAFDAELLFLCSRFGLRVAEAPIQPGADAVAGVLRWDQVGRLVAELVRIRWHFRRGLYNPPEADGSSGTPNGCRD